MSAKQLALTATTDQLIEAPQDIQAGLYSEVRIGEKQQHPTLATFVCMCCQCPEMQERVPNDSTQKESRVIYIVNG